MIRESEKFLFIFFNKNNSMILKIWDYEGIRLFETIRDSEIPQFKLF